MSYPQDLYQSTICQTCWSERGKPDSEAELEAQNLDDQWEDYPIEVSEPKCRQCGVAQRWWFFLRSRNPIEHTPKRKD